MGQWEERRACACCAPVDVELGADGAVGGDERLANHLRRHWGVVTISLVAGLGKTAGLGHVADFRPALRVIDGTSNHAPARRRRAMRSCLRSGEGRQKVAGSCR